MFDGATPSVFDDLTAGSLTSAGSDNTAIDTTALCHVGGEAPSLSARMTSNTNTRRESGMFNDGGAAPVVALVWGPNASLRTGVPNLRSVRRLVPGQSGPRSSSSFRL